MAGFVQHGWDETTCSLSAVASLRPARVSPWQAGFVVRSKGQNRPNTLDIVLGTPPAMAQCIGGERGGVGEGSHVRWGERALNEQLVIHQRPGG